MTRARIARVLSLVALAGVLFDATACFVVLASAPSRGEASELSWRAHCPCGCGQHATTLAGVGLSQPAAPQAVAVVPPGERPPLPPSEPARLPSAPPRSVDHVPISLT